MLLVSAWSFKLDRLFGRCTPIYDLGSGPHNTVRWSPHGRFAAIAGFGNLPGDLVFYEKKADGKCNKIGATRCAPCRSIGKSRSCCNAVTRSWAATEVPDMCHMAN